MWEGLVWVQDEARGLVFQQMHCKGTCSHQKLHFDNTTEVQRLIVNESVNASVKKARTRRGDFDRRVTHIDRLPRPYIKSQK